MGFRLRRATCALAALALAAIASPAAFADDDRRGDRGDRDRHHGDRDHRGDSGTIRYATFNASLNRYRDGQLVEELADPSIRPAGDRQIRTVAEIIQRVRPDVLLVNEFDFDDDGRRGTSRSAELFQDNYLSESQNGTRPIRYEHRFTAPSNTGIPSGFDLDNNGQVVTTPGPGYGNDSFGFGEFPGQFGMTVYSKYPIVGRDVRTFQKFLWKDMPGARLPNDPATPAPADWYSPEELAVFRLSSKSHWDVPIRVRGKVVHFLTSHPTPPVFDGPEDRNGTRNADEIRLWADYVTPGAGGYIYDDRGRRGGLKPGARFVIAGDQNSDPLDGDSIPGAIQQLLEQPAREHDGDAEQPGRSGAVGDPGRGEHDAPVRSRLRHGGLQRQPGAGQPARGLRAAGQRPADQGLVRVLAAERRPAVPARRNVQHELLPGRKRVPLVGSPAGGGGREGGPRRRRPRRR